MYIIIATHNEETVFRLLDLVFATKNPEDKVVIYDDFSNEEYIQKLKQYEILFYQHKLNMNFADHWNNVHQYIPVGEWIMFLAADEMLDPAFFASLKNEINSYPVDRFNFARMNTYYDETKEAGEMPNNIDWNNPSLFGESYPDLQGRAYRNLPHMKWVGPVHEVLSGMSSMRNIISKELTILHHRSTQKIVRSEVLYRAIGHPAYDNK